jgi:plasmid stability protein
VSVNLSIKNAPDDVVARLRLRARKNHRSLQGELMAILEGAVASPGRLSIDEVSAEIRRMGFASPPDAAAIIRAARDAR